MSSTPLGTIFFGNVTVEAGADTTEFGTGSVFIRDQLTATQGIASFGETRINTTNGVFEVTGGSAAKVYVTNAVEIVGNTNSHLKTSGGDITVSADAGSLFLNGSAGISLTSSGGAINLYAQGGHSSFQVIGTHDNTISSTLGRVYLDTKRASTDAISLRATNGGATVLLGSGGFTLKTTEGAVTIDSQRSSHFIVTPTDDAQDLLISVAGTTDSSLILRSSGTSATDAIVIEAQTGGLLMSATGGIVMAGRQAQSSLTNTATANGQHLIISSAGMFDNKLELSSFGATQGALTLQATNGGIAIDALTASSLRVNPVYDGQDLLIAMTGTTDSSLILRSSSRVSDAIVVEAQTGGIVMSATGSLAVTSRQASSSWTHTSTANGQNLVVALEGSTDSALVIRSSGTDATSALVIRATNGGIQQIAAGQVSIDTSDTTNGIHIAHTENVPVFIGSTSSDTTIKGNLIVQGTTTTINSETVTVTDNVLVLNAAPSGTSDAGVLFKRWQPANDLGLGDVVAGTGDETGTFQSGSTTTTLKLSTSANSTVANYYAGWWIKFVSNGVTQVRKIKSYDQNTRVATIYGTGENDGLDVAEVPVNTDTYALYNTPFAGTFYQESSDEYIFVGSNVNPPFSGAASVTKYLNLRAEQLAINTIVEKNEGEGVTIAGLLINDDTINGMTQINGATLDIVETVGLLDNASTPVDLNTATSGSYMFIVNADSTSGATATFMGSKRHGAAGQVQRISSAMGSQGEQLSIMWPGSGSQKAALKHSTVLNTTSGATVPYKVKIIRV